MGEVTELILDGVLCDECGGFVGEDVILANGGSIAADKTIEPPGFPLKCNDCKPDKRKWPIR